MNKRVEKKLLHFFTGGKNIRKDFAAAREKKTSKLRRVIRACFYVHFAAAVICIALAAVLKAGTVGIAAVSLCEVVLLGLAFLAVGDMTAIKTLLCCGDAAAACAMFATGALISENKTPFFAVGAVSVVSTLCAFGALYAAMCREFLDNFSPLAIRKEHYTVLPQLANSDSDDNSDDNIDEDFNEDFDEDFNDDFDIDLDENDYKADYKDLAEMMDDEPSEDSSADAPEEYKPKRVIAPPPKTEIQLLAEKLREILCAPKDDMVAEAMPKPAAESAPVIPENSQNITEVRR